MKRSSSFPREESGAESSKSAKRRRGIAQNKMLSLQSPLLHLLHLPPEMICEILSHLVEPAPFYLTCKQLYNMCPEKARSSLIRDSISYLRMKNNILGVYELTAFAWTPIIDWWFSEYIHDAAHENDAFWSLDAPTERSAVVAYMEQLHRDKRIRRQWIDHPYALLAYSLSNMAPTMQCAMETMRTSLRKNTHSFLLTATSASPIIMTREE